MSKLTNGFKVHGCRILHSEDNRAARLEPPEAASQEFTSEAIKYGEDGEAVAGEPTATMQAIKAARAWKAEQEENERRERLAKLKDAARQQQQLAAQQAAPQPKRTKGK